MNLYKILGIVLITIISAVVMEVLGFEAMVCVLLSLIYAEVLIGFDKLDNKKE